MVGEPLDTVLALRRRAVQEARQRLAASTEAASAAMLRARALEREIEAETERASDPAGSDRLVEAFAAWLPGARHGVAQARAAQDRHEAETNRLRAELGACRSSLEAIETLIAEREAARQALRMRVAQEELDAYGARPGAFRP